jgi:hypothetical protein
MTEQTKAERLADDLARWYPSGSSPARAAEELCRLSTVNGELLEALRECLPYVRETLLNTGSMDAYYTEAKACAAIAKAEGKV